MRGRLATLAPALGLVMPVRATTLAWDRGCPSGVLDAYLQAMVRHNARAVVLAPNARHSENTARVGLSATANAIEPYRVAALDPTTAQVAYVGVVREHDRPVLLAVRLKVTRGRVSEAETIVARDVMSFDELRAPRPPMASPLALPARVSRTAMVAGVNAYFDGIVQGDGSRIPFDVACNRLENGLQTTNNPGLAAEMASARRGAHAATAPMPLPVPAAAKRASAPSPAMPQDCRGQISSGAFAFISSVAPQRGWVIDEAQGIAFGLFRLNHRGLRPIIALRNSGSMPDPFGGTPWSMQMAEFFKSKNGRIWQVEAIGTPLPYGEATGWEG